MNQWVLNFFDAIAEYGLRQYKCKTCGHVIEVANGKQLSEKAIAHLKDHKRP